MRIAAMVGTGLILVAVVWWVEWLKGIYQRVPKEKRQQ